MAGAENGKENGARSIAQYPESRPRPPRQRAAKRHVASLGDRSSPREVKAFNFASEEVERLEEILGERSAAAESQFELCELLEHVASQHLHWRGQPPPSKTEARYQIELLAFLAGRILSLKRQIDKAQREFGETLDDLNDMARSALWQAIGEHPDWKTISGRAGTDDHFTAMEYLQGEDIDVEYVGKCAASLLSRLDTRGDYADLDLALSVAELVTLFEDWTGESATFSTVGVRRRNRGEPANHPASQCGRFVAGFFDIVDPKIGPSKPVNALRKLIQSRTS